MIAAQLGLVAYIAGNFLVCYSFVICKVKRYSHVKADLRAFYWSFYRTCTLSAPRDMHEQNYFY